ncbi:DUF4142 domain-containing protein [Pedobacter gandavensis]|uniref:DUF4142 domain-containing protein n=1 Tax=Pedobacter TaxID=84567 RepID=UPI001C9A1F11|nr:MULTISPECIES: DUF4142 domain-containing protein [Pedobacter]WGQ10083.1 DUF4142 domain-containing protein [Pedobacter gandavensis]
MKKYWRNLLPVFLLIGMQACSHADRNGRDEAATGVVDSLSDTTLRAKAITADVDVNGDGKMFVLNASTAELLEIEAANLAMNKSKDKQVKDFAARILKDHKLANEELNRIANAKGIQLVQALSGKAEGDLKVLNTLANREFDLQYIRMMIDQQQKTMQLFTDGLGLADPELKEFSVKIRPLIEQHYKRALEIGKHLNISNANNGDDLLGISP